MSASSAVQGSPPAPVLIPPPEEESSPVWKWMSDHSNAILVALFVIVVTTSLIVRLDVDEMTKLTIGCSSGAGLLIAGTIYFLKSSKSEKDEEGNVLERGWHWIKENVNFTLFALGVIVVTSVLLTQLDVDSATKLIIGCSAAGVILVGAIATTSRRDLKWHREQALKAIGYEEGLKLFLIEKGYKPVASGEDYWVKTCVIREGDPERQLDAYKQDLGAYSHHFHEIRRYSPTVYQMCIRLPDYPELPRELRPENPAAWQQVNDEIDARIELESTTIDNRLQLTLAGFEREELQHLADALDYQKKLKAFLFDKGYTPNCMTLADPEGIYWKKLVWVEDGHPERHLDLCRAELGEARSYFYKFKPFSSNAPNYYEMIVHLPDEVQLPEVFHSERQQFEREAQKAIAAQHAMSIARNSKRAEEQAAKEKEIAAAYMRAHPKLEDARHQERMKLSKLD